MPSSRNAVLSTRLLRDMGVLYSFVLCGCTGVLYYFVRCGMSAVTWAKSGVVRLIDHGFIVTLEQVVVVAFRL